MKTVLTPERSFISKITFNEGILAKIGLATKAKVRTTFEIKGKEYAYDVTPDVLDEIKAAVKAGSGVGTIYSTKIKGTGHPE